MESIMHVFKIVLSVKRYSIVKAHIMTLKASLKQLWTNTPQIRKNVLEKMIKLHVTKTLHHTITKRSKLNVGLSPSKNIFYLLQ